MESLEIYLRTLFHSSTTICWVAVYLLTHSQLCLTLACTHLSSSGQRSCSYL